MYQGTGKLIGYRTYTSKEVEKHVYSILAGTHDPKTGLYDKCELLTVIEDTQVLKDLKPCNVRFDIEPRTYGKETKNIPLNIKVI